LWKLDRHLLLCGDSTNPTDVDRLMAGEKAALCATDPPYCVDYTGERPDKEGGNTGGKNWTAVYREVEIEDADVFFTGVFTSVLRVLAPHSLVYCWHAQAAGRPRPRLDEGGVVESPTARLDQADGGVRADVLASKT
jgi:DNA modification methylase